MPYLLDTNVMWRRFDVTDSRHATVKAAIDTLVLRGETVYITAQNLIEYQAVATRPTNVNGLGYSTALASQKALDMQALFSFLPETPAIYPQWRALVDQHNVMGKQVHDTRLVAVMFAYGVTHFLTLNPTHFLRFSGITVVEPEDVK